MAANITWQNETLWDACKRLQSAVQWDTCEHICLDYKGVEITFWGDSNLSDVAQIYHLKHTAKNL